MNRSEEKNALARLAALFDEAEPQDEASRRAELEAAGLDPALVRARMRAFAKAGRLAAQGGHTARRPSSPPAQTGGGSDPIPVPWVEKTAAGWKIDLAVASPTSEERSWMTFDFRETGLAGGVRIGLLLNTAEADESSLTVEWEADFLHERGWLLSIYHADENTPLFQRNIGSGYRGSVILTADVLGTNPALVPLKFSFDPDRSD